SVTDGQAVAPAPVARRFDRLGVLVSAIAAGAALSPFVIFRANRIAPGESIALWRALPVEWSALALGAIGLAAAASLLARSPHLRLGAACLSLLALFPALGRAASLATPAADGFARVSPGAGFWLLALALGLLLSDALLRLRAGPW